MQGARLRYVQLLFEAQRRSGLPEPSGKADLQALVEEWIEVTTVEQAQVRRWDTEGTVALSANRAPQVTFVRFLLLTNTANQSISP